jgi:hypothetical protein
MLLLLLLLLLLNIDYKLHHHRIILGVQINSLLWISIIEFDARPSSFHRTPPMLNGSRSSKIISRLLRLRFPGFLLRIDSEFYENARN